MQSMRMRDKLFLLLPVLVLWGATSLDVWAQDTAAAAHKTEAAVVPITAPVLTAAQKEPYLTAQWVYSSLLAQQLSISQRVTEAYQALQIAEVALRNTCGKDAELTGVGDAKPACTLKSAAAAVPPPPLVTRLPPVGAGRAVTAPSK